MPIPNKSLRTLNVIVSQIGSGAYCSASPHGWLEEPPNIVHRYSFVLLRTITCFPKAGSWSSVHHDVSLMLMPRNPLMHIKITTLARSAFLFRSLLESCLCFSPDTLEWMLRQGSIGFAFAGGCPKNILARLGARKHAGDWLPKSPINMVEKLLVPGALYRKMKMKKALCTRFCSAVFHSPHEDYGARTQFSPLSPWAKQQ